MSDRKYSKVCEVKPKNDDSVDAGKVDSAKVDAGKVDSAKVDAVKPESAIYISKKTNNRDNSREETNKYNDNSGNRRYDNSRNNNNYNGDNTRRNDNSNSGDNRRYDNSRRNDNSNGDNRQYDNRQYDNSRRNDNSNGDNRRYDNRNGDNRRYDNRNGDNRNGDNRNGDNRNGNRRYNSNQQNDNTHYESNQDDYKNTYSQQKESKESTESLELSESIKQSEESIESNEPLVLTAEQIAKREECMIPIETFDDLSQHIDLKIIRGVMSYGFDTPSPIQQKAIKPFLSKFDIIAQAQSGTGKTATFCIGTLGNIDFTKNETQAIILAHTMELAQQIEHVFSNIGSYTDLRLALAVKSISVRENIDLCLGKNKDGLMPHVVIGTPGRLLDMITKKIIDMNTIRVLVLDEADELLSEGFIKQIRQIIGSINSKTQIGLFSATMDTNFIKMTDKFMRNPINILINKENLTLDGIIQYNIECERNEYKFETLCDLYSLISTSQTIIYCNHHQSVELLTKKLQEQNFKVSLIHGSMDITEREDAMKKFRSLNTRVLISTDLLGRGIDVQQVSIVINYDIPFKNESYIHRIGRSGRHGRKGTAINFVTNNDVKRIDEIAKYYNTKILPLPADLSSVFQTE
jgi:translation initiation factor 4A